MLRRYLLPCAGLLTLLFAGVALACPHAPAGYKGSLAETSQQAIIFWRDGCEELILKVDYKLTPAGEAPKHIAWVVPVPTKPDSYAEVKSAKIFEEAFQLATIYDPILRVAPKGGQPRVVVLGKITVGMYEVTEVKATGEDAAKELNAWLKAEGYGEIPAKGMAYYVKHDWTFLAIKLKEADKGLTTEGGFRPLRIAFKTDRLVYPLKFSSPRSAFDVTLYVFTDRPISLPKGLKDRGFTDRALAGEPGSTKIDGKELRWNEAYWRLTANAPESSKERKEIAAKRLKLIEEGKDEAETELYRLVKDVEKGKLGKFDPLYLTQVSGHIKLKGDTGDNELADWEEDFQIAVVKK